MYQIPSTKDNEKRANTYFHCGPLLRQKQTGRVMQVIYFCINAVNKHSF